MRARGRACSRLFFFFSLSSSRGLLYEVVQILHARCRVWLQRKHPLTGVIVGVCWILPPCIPEIVLPIFFPKLPTM